MFRNVFRFCNNGRTILGLLGTTWTLIWSLELWAVVFAVLSYAVYCEHISEYKAMDHVLVIRVLCHIQSTVAWNFH